MTKSKYEFNNDRSVASNCPCGRSNHDGKFAPFIGYTNKGYCHSCHKTFWPDTIGTKGRLPRNYIPTPKEDKSLNKIKDSAKISLIGEQTLHQTLGIPDDNSFYNFLIKLTNYETARLLQLKYSIGTLKNDTETIIFWLIDFNERIRSGKIIKYQIKDDKNSFIGINCNRIKETNRPVKWVHSAIGKDKFNFKSCFFGEHLLKKFPELPVGIVESEKSAIIAAAYFPNFVWLASGGAGGLTKEKVRVLKNRKIVLFPDLGKFSEWEKSSILLRNNAEGSIVKVSTLLENSATDEDRVQGFDLADYLIREDYTKFVNEN